MRLIETFELRMFEFTPDNLPKYAILSHTWADGEISFVDFPTEAANQKAGLQKIRSCCFQAHHDGYNWLWIDTCCIDKTSSAELSEAINSMYTWYQNAEICYVYLSDVPFENAFDKLEKPKSATTGAKTNFAGSRWFTRGWTLQELLAPQRVEFFSSDWRTLGSKRELVKRLSVATGISDDVLLGKRSVRSTSIAKRMSWAANRQTTRVEDTAYCLMGLFNVNMPMLYGEGEKAFIRLQEEIMKITNDQSIFAWVDKRPDLTLPHGLLAHHPECFAHTGDFTPFAELNDSSTPQVMTNRGVSATVFMWPRDERFYFASLTCAKQSMPNKFAAVVLRKVGSTDSQFVREGGFRLITSTLRGTPRQIYVRQPGRTDEAESEPLQRLFFEVHLRETEAPCSLHLFQVAPGCQRLHSRVGQEPNTGVVMVNGDYYFDADPSEFAFSLPVVPGMPALSAILKGTDWQVRIRLGTDEAGQIGWDAHSDTPAYKPFDQIGWDASFKPRSEANFLFASKNDGLMYQLEVKAKSLDELTSSAQRTKVDILVTGKSLKEQLKLLRA